MLNFSGTEEDVAKEVSSTLKYAPDRLGGGGRRNGQADDDA